MNKKEEANKLIEEGKKLIARAEELIKEDEAAKVIESPEYKFPKSVECCLGWLCITNGPILVLRCTQDTVTSIEEASFYDACIDFCGEDALKQTSKLFDEIANCRIGSMDVPEYLMYRFTPEGTDSYILERMEASHNPDKGNWTLTPA